MEQRVGVLDGDGAGGVVPVVGVPCRCVRLIGQCDR